MQILFVASTAVITSRPAASAALYLDALGLPLSEEGHPGYFASEALEGSKHFGLWPLADAAEACFGTQAWPASHPVPQASIEFEVADPDAVGTGAEELTAAGHVLLHAVRTEPWGQTLVRLQSPEGVLVGLSYTPWMH